MAGVIYRKPIQTSCKNYYEVLPIHYQSKPHAKLLRGISNASNNITIKKNAFCIREMTPQFWFLMQVGNGLMTTGWIDHDFYRQFGFPDPKRSMLGVMDDIVVTEIIMKTILHRACRWRSLHCGKEEWIEIQKVIDRLIWSFLDMQNRFIFTRSAFWEISGRRNKHTTLSRMLTIEQYCVENV